MNEQARAPVAEGDLRAVINANADGMVVVDPYGVITYVNPAAERLFNRAGDELVGSFFGFPVHDGGDTEIGIFRGAVPLTVEMRVTRLTWEGQPAHLAALRDITSRKHAEQMLRSAVELRDDVISVVSHDFRSPLATILGAVGILLDDAEEFAIDDDRRVTLEQIQRSAADLNRMVESLLTLSRIEGDELRIDVQPVDVDQTIRHTLERLRDAGHDEDIRVDCAEGVTADTDAGHLQQILTNYLSNALKHGAPPVEVRATAGDADVEILVCDQGQGVPEEVVPRLFDRFSRGRQAEDHDGGVGIGLTVARRLAEASGGETWYAPNQPRGACFGLRLPAGGADPDPD